MGINGELLICGEPDLAEIFFPLLVKGAKIDVRVGGTLKDLLLNQLSLDPAYVDEALQTIFHNFKAVDDVDHTVIGEGDVVALCGPMPGLMGATLRRGGRYAAMRREISGEKGRVKSSGTPGCICLKLFNTVLYDLGAKILSRGVGVLSADLIPLLQENESRLLELSASFSFGGRKMALKAVITAAEGTGRCGLKIISHHN